MKIQIHIAGSKRSGKTSLGRKLRKSLAEYGFIPAIFDIDDVRRELFGKEDAKASIGSEANRRFHAAAYEHIFVVLIPKALTTGRLPITIATHANRTYYDRACAIADFYGAKLGFFLLEVPSFHEVIRRAAVDTESLSDTKDLLGNPAEKEAYLASTSMFETSYRGKPGKYVWIRQEDKEIMARNALAHLADIVNA